MDPEFFSKALDQVSDGVYALDVGRRVTYWSAGSQRITGYAAEDVVGRHCAAGVLRHVDGAGHQLCGDACPLAAVMRDGQARESELYLHHADGHRVPVIVRGQALRNEAGEIIGAIEVFAPSSGNVFTEQLLAADPDATDPVSGLVVRRIGEQQLDALLARAAQDGTSLGVLFVDADDFKSVNDTFGHVTGDQALRMVGQSMSGGLRRGDIAVRWGGEEFLALLPEVDGATLGAVAERVRMLVENSWIQHESGQVRVTVSVGATLARPGEDAAVVLERADAHMYASKHAGRNRVTMDLVQRSVPATRPVAAARSVTPTAVGDPEPDGS